MPETQPDSVLLEVADGVGTITLNRPEQGNAIDLALAERLSDVVAEVAERDDVDAVLLTGNGRQFCVGGDLGWMAAQDEPGPAVGHLAEAAHRAVLGLHELAKPMVGVVDGAAAGAGLSLVLLCDVVLGTPRTALATAYTAVGLSPDCGQSWLLPRAVGVSRALDLTLRSRRILASEALRLGLLSEVVESEELAQTSRTIVGRLAATPAHGAARRLVRAEGEAFAAQLDREAESIARMAATPQSRRLVRERRTS